MKILKITTAMIGAVLLIGTVGCSSNGASTAPDAGAGSNDGTSQSTDVRLVSMAGITTNTAINQGIESGVFSDNGLNATLLEVENPPAALASMQGGNAEFAYAPLSTALTALSQGIDIRIVAAAEGFPEDGTDAEKYDDTGLVINPADGLTSTADLTDKIVAVPSRNGMMEIVIANAIDAAGGDHTQAEWQALDQQSQISALVQNRIQGAGLATPFTTKAEEEGMKTIVRPKALFFESGAAGVWITTAEIAEKQPELVASFQKAVAETNAWANDNLVEIAKIVVAQRELTTAPEDLIVGYFPTSVSLTDVERAAQKMTRLGFLEGTLDLASVVIPAK